MIGKYRSCRNLLASGLLVASLHLNAAARAEDPVDAMLRDDPKPTEVPLPTDAPNADEIPQSQDEAKGHYEFQPVGDFVPYVTGLLEAEVKKEADKYEAAQKATHAANGADAPSAEPWKGSMIRMAASYSFDLVFSPESGDGKPFRVFAGMFEKEAVVKNSRPKYSNHKEGVKFEYPRRGIRNMFIDGAEGAGVLLMTFALPDKNTNGLLLCPRDMTGPSLKPNAFRLKEVRPAPYAKADATYPGKDRSAYAVARVYTSTNVPACDPFEKEAKGDLPFAKVECGSDSAPAYDRNEKIVSSGANLDAFDCGIIAGVELKNSDGSEFLRTTEAVYSIRKLDIGFITYATVRGYNLRVDPGVCYMLVRRGATVSEAKPGSAP